MVFLLRMKLFQQQIQLPCQLGLRDWFRHLPNCFFETDLWLTFQYEQNKKWSDLVSIRDHSPQRGQVGIDPLPAPPLRLAMDLQRPRLRRAPPRRRRQLRRASGSLACCHWSRPPFSPHQCEKQQVSTHSVVVEHTNDGWNEQWTAA